MNRFALIISIFSLTYAQYDIYNLNNYNYDQDSLRTINLTHVAKSFIVPGWGQLNNKDPLWKPILFFGIESIAIGSNLHFTKKSNNYKSDFENYADLHWDLQRWFENTKIIFPDNWSDIIVGTHKLGLQINGRYFSTNTLESLSRQHSWSDILVVRDRDFYENIGKYDQFVGGWSDDFDNPFDDKGNWFSEEKGDVESVVLTKRKNYYRNLRHKSNINSSYARYAVSALMLNHIASGFDALINNYNINSKIGKFSIQFLPYRTLNEGGVLFNISW